MSHKWDDTREKRLLVEVIAFTNPKVEGSAWAAIAANMGEGATAEACRQKFQGIKRNLNTAAASAFASDSSKPATPKAAAKAPKPKTPASTTTTTTKGRKRKADEATFNEDDDDDNDNKANLPPPKSQKVKKEHDANGISAELFKVEKEGKSVDLIRDDLYSNSAA